MKLIPRGLKGASRRARLRFEKPQILLHINTKKVQPTLNNPSLFIRRLEQWGEENGIPTNILASTEKFRRFTATSQHLNIYFEVSQPNNGRHVLHTCPTYFKGYWYLDKDGVRECSSIGLNTFKPGNISPKIYKPVINELRRKTLKHNHAKWDQPEPGSVPLLDDAIVFFCQEENGMKKQEYYMNTAEMIAGVITNRGNRRVYIKPHPCQQEQSLAEIEQFHDPKNEIEVVNAHMHDLLKCCAFSCSISSSTAMQGFLHNKPAITAAVVDFHHNLLNVRDQAELKEAMGQIEHVKFHHDEYLYWYLEEQNLAPHSDDIMTRLNERILTTGFKP